MSAIHHLLRMKPLTPPGVTSHDEALVSVPREFRDFPKRNSKVKFYSLRVDSGL